MRISGRDLPTPGVEIPVEVECDACGIDFVLSARNHRNHVRRGTSPRCGECRHGRAPREGPDEEDRRFWRERFSIEEICMLAWAIWPERASVRCPGSWTEGLASGDGEVNLLRLHHRGNGEAPRELQEDVVTFGEIPR